MIKIFMSGCHGRMGQAIVAQSLNSDKYQVIAGFDGVDKGGTSFPVYHSFENIQENPDLVIDFSHISATEKVLEFCIKKNIPLVLATTGIEGDLQATVEKASQHIPIFKSFNMSLGISLLQALVRQASKVLGGQYDIEIIEKHHNQKVDAPSGTALMIADAASSVLSFKPQYIYDRTQEHQKRDPHEIGIHAVRGGTIVGEHEALFIGPNEILSISHSAQSRELFANGALKAAEFIVGKAPGLYNMDDLVASLS